MFHYFTPQCYRLGFGIIARMTGWGFALGGACGAVVGFLALSLVPVVDFPACLLSSAVGAALGSANGLLLGFVIGCTLVLFSIKGLPTDIVGYLRIAKGISAYWVIVNAILLGFVGRPEEILVFVPLIAIYSSIVFGVACFASDRVVRWVERELS